MILDTNALSAFVDGDLQLRAIIEHESQLAVPTVVLGEYLFGVQQSRWRTRYEEWLNTNLDFFEILPIGRQTATYYAEIRRELKRAAHPIPTNDLWIAALGKEHDLPIVSRDRHFQAVPGLRLLTW